MSETYEQFLEHKTFDGVSRAVSLINGEAQCAERLKKFNIYSWGKFLLDEQLLGDDEIGYIITNIRRTAAGYMCSPTELDNNHVPIIATKSVLFETIEDIVNFNFSGMHLYTITNQYGIYKVRYGESYNG